MKKVVIFGVGNNWKRYEKNIKKRFLVVGYIDNNWEKIGGR